MEASVIIVSHSRPVELKQMLACLRFQDVGGFEVIVVTNTPEAIGLAPPDLHVIPFEQANIAKARNAGIAAAKGRFIAFCDDDALPDPGWLRHLLAPFATPEVGGTGGFTRGRNGISPQWGAVETDVYGNAYPVDIDRPTVFAPTPARAPVMIGTNCAFRASALESVGGFDPVFAYYLDDSDLSLRLSQAGWKLAITPLAQVHHGFAAGPHRTRNRVPTTLFLIGQSKAYFCKKHGQPAQVDAQITAFRTLHRNRLESQLLAGLFEPAHLHRMLGTLDEGLAAGAGLTVAPPVSRPPTLDPTPATLPDHPQTHVLLAGRPKDRRWLTETAAALSERNIMVTALILHLSARYMQVRFSENGFWLHEGGQFGKAARFDPLFRRVGFKQRILNESKRLSTIRPVDFIILAQTDEKAATFPPQIPDINGLDRHEIIALA